MKKWSKKQEGGFLNIIIGTSGTSALGNLLAGKGTIRAVQGAF